MATNHTPGPWQVFNGGAQIGTPEDKDGVLYVAETRYISNGESAANARLIAAAPDLLEALERALFILQSPIVSGYCTPTTNKASGTLDTIRAAIAKARGEG